MSGWGMVRWEGSSLESPGSQMLPSGVSNQ